MKHTCARCGKEFTGRKKKYCSEDCSKEAIRIRNRERWRKANPSWNEGATKVCEWCGDDYTVAARAAHRARFCSGKCKDTWWSREVHGHEPAEKRNAQRKRFKLIRQNKIKEEKELAYLKRLTIKECEWCGSSFETDTPSQVTCSVECRRKRRNRLSSIRSDKRINESNIIDTDITLERLYEIEKGICYLCGKECDYNDIIITDEGHYITGKNYPSIDHVKPLSKNGKHAWNNVKLAHHRCNTLKSNKIVQKERSSV